MDNRWHGLFSFTWRLSSLAPWGLWPPLPYALCHTAYSTCRMGALASSHLHHSCQRMRKPAAHARTARASSTADPTWHMCMPLPATDRSQDSLMMSGRSQAKGHREANPDFGSIAGTGSPCICRVSAGSNSLRPSILYNKLFLVRVGAHPEGLMNT
jgi:hypothetical protein